MADRSLSSLRRDAAGCRACPLWENATQPVFGEGRAAIHLSAILRAGERREPELASFVDDLNLVASVL